MGSANPGGRPRGASVRWWTVCCCFPPFSVRYFRMSCASYHWKMLADARRGCWAADDKVFVVVQTRRVAEAMGQLWEVQAGGLADLGAVTVVRRGNAIQWIEVGERWLAIARPRCRQLLPANCQLELLHPHVDPASRTG